MMLRIFQRRRLYSSFAWAGRRLEDEGDWRYSAEWWGTQGGGFGYDRGHTVFRQHSLKGNGLVTVTAHPASTPTTEHWPALERQLQQRYERFIGGHEICEQVRILGYQWRVLRFNDITRQSVAKVIAVYEESNPGHVFLMQQPHCLAFPCALVDVVEIDKSVISASILSMGFPNVSKTDSTVHDYYSEHSLSGLHFNKSSHIIDKVFWEGIKDRILLNEADGEAYICDSLMKDQTNEKCSLCYDMVFVDAYDGYDILPHKFRNRNGPFLSALQSKLHPRHGTVAVNLHSDLPHPSLQERLTGNYGPGFSPFLPLGRQILEVCRVYREALQFVRPWEAEKEVDLGLTFTVAVPCLQNVSLVVTRGFSPYENGELKSRDHSGKIPPTNSCFTKELILKNLIAETQTVEKLLDLPFDSSQFVRRGFFIIN